MSTIPKPNGSVTEPDEMPSRPDDDLEAHVDLIEASGLFDELAYARISGAAGDRRTLVRHYLAHGEGELLSPSDEFDVAFYRHTNPDVAAARGNLLVHYLRYGALEGRYPNWRRLRLDATKLVQSGLFDAHLFAQHYPYPRLRGLTDAECYLTARTENLIAGTAFDERFYCDAYEDTRRYRGKPLLQYLDAGRREWRVATPEELRERKRMVAHRFDTAYYLAQFPPGDEPADPLEHFILHGMRAGLNPCAEFCLDYYVRRYPDVADATDPFAHYCSFGADEGRVGRLHLSDWFVSGARAFDLRKPTVLVASHEASRTGAPLVGLTVVAALAERYNVVVSLGRSGPLLERFVEHACLYVVAKPSALDAEYLLEELKATYGVAAILLNSVETGEYASAALYAGVASVALLHEFAEYTLPAGRMSAVVESVDRVVVPAELVRESLQRELQFHRGGPANNVVVRPQGFLPQLPPDPESADLTREQILAVLQVDDADRTRIVLGAGHVQMRKGIDLFVQTAAETRAICGDDVRFIWVGDGYEPAADLAYSAWIADMVRRLDLERHVFFLPPQASLDVLFGLAHAFYLPSRLDPFPNVVLDAFAAGKPVVCFDRATGVADELRSGNASGAAVAYCDVREAARALTRFVEPDAMAEARRNVDLARTRYDFGAYAAFIEQQLERVQSLRAHLVATAREIAAAGTFDAAFHDGSDVPVSEPAAWRSLLDYTARGSKGLLRYNPRPGYNEGAARAAAAGAGAPATHRCVLLDERMPAPPYTGRVALHLHLHYAELARDLFTALTQAGAPMDIFITTTSARKQLEIQYEFRTYALGSVRVIDVPNRGRDIGPLLTAVKPFLRSGGYDVVGHLHGKRSLAVDSGLGERWRTYLTNALLGGRDNVRRVLSLFGADPALGLVFAEDRHCVGWTKNKACAEDLAAELVPHPAVPDFPVFPLGTMFWARPDALEPLWRNDVDPARFPLEPLPYDGSLLHAIERMLPSIVESTGRSWCTVYRPGSGW